MPLAALVVSNNKLEVIHLTQYTETWVVVCLVKYGNWRTLILNVCLPWNVDLEPFLQKLNDIMSEHRDIPIMLLGDMNSKSHLWHSKITDKRGSLMEDLANVDGLFVNDIPLQRLTVKII